MPPNILTGKEFLRGLEKLGIVPPNVQRVVIDADYHGLVSVYYQGLGGHELLHVDLTGAQITVIAPKDAVA